MDKQKLFCLHYLQSFNATKAYQQAYNVGYKTAMASGSRLLNNPKITAELKQLKQIRQEAEALTAEDVLHELKRQAFADLGDYIEFATREEAATTKRDANAATKHSYVYLKDQADVDTSLLKSVKVGKDSVVVELADKQRALFELLKHLEPTATASAQPQPIIVDDIHAEQMGVNDDEET
ncbi:terminase small subunit [Furfurilactobacillus entadae]|uniref:terminase small subunit n=1 Tax=Furfurilactobacillus entadae TaxID=2922307 RepID=UPI0035EC1E72